MTMGETLLREVLLGNTDRDPAATAFRFLSFGGGSPASAEPLLGLPDAAPSHLLVD